MTGPIHQPDCYNIETWDGRRWHGGANRESAESAIAYARAMSAETGRRYRVYGSNGDQLFDTHAAPAAAASTAEVCGLQLGNTDLTSERDTAWVPPAPVSPPEDDARLALDHAAALRAIAPPVAPEPLA